MDQTSSLRDTACGPAAGSHAPLRRGLEEPVLDGATVPDPPAEVRRTRAVLRVLVAAELSLIADSVCAALRGPALHPVVLPWPTPSGHLPAVVPTDRATVGLLLTDLDREERVRRARTLLAETPRTTWLVLTEAPPGPLWGAVLECGARLVRPSATRVVELQALLLDGTLEDDPMADEREGLVAQWIAASQERQDLSARVALLTPREEEVLRLLYRGETVTRIATGFAVSESTVRSQVKAILRKLEVGSQLAAVAAYGLVARDEEVSPAPAAGRRPRGSAVR